MLKALELMNFLKFMSQRVTVDYQAISGIALIIRAERLAVALSSCIGITLSQRSEVRSSVVTELNSIVKMMATCIIPSKRIFMVNSELNVEQYDAITN